MGERRFNTTHNSHTLTRTTQHTTHNSHTLTRTTQHTTHNSHTFTLTPQHTAYNSHTLTLTSQHITLTHTLSPTPQDTPLTLQRGSMSTRPNLDAAVERGAGECVGILWIEHHAHDVVRMTFKHLRALSAGKRCEWLCVCMDIFVHTELTLKLISDALTGEFDCEFDFGSHERVRS